MSRPAHPNDPRDRCAHCGEAIVYTGMAHKTIKGADARYRRKATHPTYSHATGRADGYSACDPEGDIGSSPLATPA